MKLVLKKNYLEIEEKVKKACKEANRNPDEVEIIAICKRQCIEKVSYVRQLGIKSFGENRVQDAKKRWSILKKEKATLRFVGPLQSNKADEAVSLFDVIETIDRDKVALAVSRAEIKLQKKREYMIQVNTGEENQKSGIPPQNVDNFILRAKKEYGLNIAGLMCIPPENENPAIHFAFLREISYRNNLKKLSMGMSNDFETAIEFGATHIRIGTSLFGERLLKEEQ